MKQLKLLMLLLIGLSGQLFAQTSPDVIVTQDVVYLLNGSVFKGKILEYEKGAVLLLELEGGSVVEIEDSEIDKVVQEAVEIEEKEKKQSNTSKYSKPKEDRVYQFKENGIYNAIYFSSSNGQANGELQVGIGAHNVFGYQFNRWFGLGFGVGVDSYSFQDGETLFPVFLEARGYFKKSWSTLFYSMNAGYGFATTNEEEQIIEADGGLMFHPCVGYRFGANKDANVLIDFGYKFQWASFTRQLEFTGDREVRDLLFKRMTIRLGLIF
ncbi:MAG: hypothetical protein MRY78_18345 [Saprospiraceae bacterium]|nr:hypothetical protein [Saprospiraceae bacterium]